ncbi:hypothetical protein BJF89_07380 [Corynebacterium sp. CNJ-954]|uniref:hypothetical protein n=1 Tax=Corynebacterium sp. CNJ-954 TaxID=1904962 RepID=UPI000960EAE1|nr:hypothetical protein [Corynebacterium sp. CNJ-954]OLT51515.1 hypothetical protein BJF89_07380 [Corynebacterium sp. CNJ-954]
MTNAKPDPARNSPARIEAREKATQAVSLRTHGLSWAEVAVRAGYPSPDAARVAVARTLDRVEAGNVADLRAEEDAHLMLIRKAALPAALEGNPQSLAVLLRTSESRRRLFGADGPEAQAATSDELEQLAQEATDAFNEMFDRVRKEARQEGLRQAHEELSQEQIAQGL